MPCWAEELSNRRSEVKNRQKFSYLILVLLLLVVVISTQGQQLRPVKVMAANITSGKYQQYESPGIRIFQAFKPDICCIQEFNYDGAIADLVQTSFGQDFRYYREPYNNGGDIPNGVIYHKDFVQLDSGSWSDSQITNRGYAYVRLDVPGANNPHLFVISVHLSTKSDKRQIEARELLQYVGNYFGVSNVRDIPDYLVLGGDFNAGSRNSEVLWILKQESNGLLWDQPIPVDHNGNSATNATRKSDHDYVLTNQLLLQCHVPLQIGNQSFPNGLVFDSRVYKPLSDLAPVQSSDSGASYMQHMAVLKMFLLPTD